MLYAGFYEKEITPPMGGTMPGALLEHKVETIESRLYAKAACFESGNKRALIIMVDLIGLNSTIHNRVVERVHEMTGINNEEIMITATHTHYGPPIADDSEFNVFDEIHFDVMVRLIADCGVMAYRKMEAVTVKYAETKVEGLTFCRNIKLKDGRVKTNPVVPVSEMEGPFGKADETLTMLYFVNEDKEPIGSLMNFACHNCCVKLGGLSSDYSGWAAKELKKVYGLEFVTLFINGFCGNLNHIDFSRDNAIIYANRGNDKTPRYQQMGKILADRAVKMFDTAKEIDADKIVCRKDIVILKKRPIPKELVEQADELYKTIPLEGLLEKVSISDINSKYYLRTRSRVILKCDAIPDEVENYVQVIRLGEFLMYALPHEMYAEFGLRIREESPSKYMMLAERSNEPDSRGYVPTKDAFGTDIYEAGILSAHFEPDSGDILTDKALEIAKEIMK